MNRFDRTMSKEGIMELVFTEQPRIGHREDALEALKDAIERWII